MEQGIKDLFVIGDRNYSTVKLPAMQALPLHARVIKAFGRGIGESLGNLDRGMDNNSVATIILGAMTQADTEALVELLPEVMMSVRFGENRLMEPHFSQHFNEYPQDIYPVFAWVLAVNISPFFANSGQGWNAFATHLGWLSPKDGKKPGLSQDPSLKESSRGQNLRR